MYKENASKGRGADTVEKLRKMLTGDRKGTWSLHVTRNRRMTFRIEDDDVIDLNLEDSY